MAVNRNKKLHKDQASLRQSLAEMQSPDSGEPHSSSTQSRRMPPMMMRGVSSVPSNVKKVRQRKRLDLPVASEGVEIRLPSLPVIRTGWRILSVLIVAAILSALIYFWSAPIFQVKAAEVVGAVRITPDEVNNLLNLGEKQIASIDPNWIKAKMSRAFPELSKIDVQVMLPASIVVNVVERDPVLLWVNGDDRIWIDTDGVAFYPRGEAEGLVVIQGALKPLTPVIQPQNSTQLSQPQSYLDPEMVAAILEMNAFVPNGSPVIFNPDYGLGWKEDRGWNVYFGTDISDIETKLKIYQAIVDELNKKGIEPAIINIEHTHAPYYRMEP